MLRRPKAITLVSLSDLHAGSKLAPCPKVVEFDDGGSYDPSTSKIQTYLNGRLQAFYDTVEDRRRDKLVFLLNGDLVDGMVKESTQVISNHPHVEFAVLKDVLAPLVKMKPDRVVVTRGTEAHVGKGAHKDEAAAHYLKKECGLNVIPCPETKKWSHYVARMELNGHYIVATHHGKVGQVPWSNVIANRALKVYLDYVTRGLRPPDLVLQAHNHKFDDSYHKHKTRIVQQGAFQLLTAHAHKVVPLELSDLGGVIVQAGSQLEVEHIRFFPDEPERWSLSL